MQKPAVIGFAQSLKPKFAKKEKIYIPSAGVKV